MVRSIYSVNSSRRIGKTVTNKKLGRPVSEFLSIVAEQHIRQIVIDADAESDKNNGKQITINDINNVLLNYDQSTTTVELPDELVMEAFINVLIKSTTELIKKRKQMIREAK